MGDVRLFVGIVPPSEVTDHLAERVGRLGVARAAAAGTNTRLTPPERRHVTLAFLGDVDDERIEEVGRAVGAAATAVLPFQVWLTGGGRFGSGRSTVLWLGGDLPQLRGLAQGVRRELRAAGLPYDGKAYTPHLTFARPGDRLPDADVEADRAALDAYTGPAWTVNAVTLVRTPDYTRLAAWAL